ncbi:bifunctional 4-hydroxy-2-oxoglutarate aldolase/2-dehydro-3-deoxy-phosphogluconate aldolase [Mycolicibacterium goodii]|uniref:2-dehydro-3-deoxy-phosphogluconate aldolase n=1 Tax=Mycolicibacterium goodii TaxID=134601 RepID=A0ABS6HJF8_MYCGD|nr:bifunctional 4-hydroxy-2-oxoglutarate aldolase/2-dehydro-3-deoxy-phosphogluconate aldolase [Mycolicibacterium goodii]MBU8814558.1 bifunctional 4-hydroxy-2-oxoglutarate aldolase/2-dehydro-3-deoxy-phosphogluconate aldolase [Mycolicibacterium goodii]MBU8822827.1 bifunctional 4-hydroxy-2-oxoglutarate aldolase/2-dehydro-3-deoxy-phosphogluconate aldolase [Mycolicibacterium goodii]MBU8829156.1 bifunctional 4-hydroxy-2-oxoglutarate aldolase/2-dehydro-3-deoxy-phosphogluconate aldolase [Mycolicibacteri
MTLLDIVPVIPVVVVRDAAHAVPIAKALVEGGLPVIELTLRTPAALEAIKRIAEEVPEITVGAGTIVDTAQPKQAAANGAQFLVSPGSTPALRAAMRDSGLPHLPGVSTVSEVLTLLEEGYTELKFFPAEPAGGAAYLRAIHSPVPAARFCPTGGITPANMGDYLASPNVGCVGGSWLTPADVVARQDWAAVAQLAETARSTAVRPAR